MNRPGGAPGNDRSLLFAIVALAITAAALSPTLFNGFTTWDDPLYILENPLVRSLSPGNVVKIFSTGQYAGNYHPLTLLFTAVEYSLFGPAPLGFHVTSLLLHLGIVFLVYRFAERLTGSVLTAFGASLLFGVHPLHLEPVAWLADQKDLLYTIFYVGALCGYLRTREKGGTGAFFLAVTPLFILSLLSKALAVTLPVVLLLIEFHLEGRLVRERVLRIAPLLGLSIVFGVVAVVAQSGAGAITNLPSETALDKTLYATTGFVTYILKLLVPYGLSPYYPYPEKIPAWYFASPLIAVGLVVLAAAVRKKSPGFFFGFAFFTVTILPVLQFVQVGNAMMADRYAYLPSIGILLIVAGRMVGASDRLGKRIPAGRVAGWATGGIYALALAALTFSLGGIWRNGVTVWDRVTKEFPREAKAYFNRGYASHTLGDYAAAIADYNMTLSLKPGYPYARFNRGTSYVLHGKQREALADFNAELGNHPGEPSILLWRGTLYSNLSLYDRAIADFSEVLEREPGNFNALARRGSARTSAGDLAGALGDYSAAIDLRPSELYLYFNRGNVLAGMGRYDEAIADYSTVLRDAPDDRDVLYGRALLYHLQERDDEACADLVRAAALGSAPAGKAVAEICGK